MKKVHFFKAKSRLGIPHIPIHQKLLNLGVEDGADAILSKEFLAKFADCEVSEYSFPLPENIEKRDFNKILKDSIINFKNLINHHLNKGQIQVVIGGDHSVTLPSVLALIERGVDPKDIGYIQFDSHGDIHLKGTSPTDNFHGMYVRPLVDHFDIPEVEKLVPLKLPAKNLIYIGNLDVEVEERGFLDKQKIKIFDKQKILKNKKSLLKTFKNFLNNYKHLHATFDIDVFDKSVAPATGIPAENGLFFEDVKPFLEIINNHPSFSFDLCEVNPQKEGSAKTIKIARWILLTVLS